LLDMVTNSGGQAWRTLLIDVGPLGLAILLTFAKLTWLAARVIGTAGPVLLVSAGALGLCMMVIAPLAFFPRLLRLLILLPFEFAVASLTLADSIHNRFFGDSIAITELAYAHQLTAVTSSVVRLLQPSDILYYAPLIGMLLALPSYLRAARHVPCLSLRRKALLSMVLLAGGLVLAGTAGRAAARDERAYSAFSRYAVLDPPASTFGWPQRERVRAFLERRYARDGAGASSVFGAARGCNLILISAESLNAFPVGLRLFGQPVMPNFAALVSESLYFDNFYDQAGGTSNAELIALQSLHALSGGAVSMRYPGNHFKALPGVLAGAGYTTMSAVGAAPAFWNMQQMHTSLGFQRSYFEDSYQASERINGWVADIPFFEKTAVRLRLQAKPFMAFLLSSTNHLPFVLPPQERRLDTSGLEGTAVGNYLQSVHYFDRALGDFVAALRQEGLLETSVLAIYGDHHAYLPDTRALPGLVGIDANDDFAMWLLEKKVPFLIRLPRGEHARVVNTPGGHLDIAPTLLAVLGIPREAPMLGRDLTQPGERLVVFGDGSFTDGRYYSIRSAGRVACFDRARSGIVPCGILEEKRREALDELQTSAFIIQGDMVGELGSTDYRHR
jgi:lipoteichoic acid synthase